MKQEDQIEIDRDMLIELLATALEDQSGFGPSYFDRETFELLEAEDIPANGKPDRYIKIVPRPFTEPLERMTRFVSTVNDAKAKQALEHALSEEKPFRAFKDALRLYPILEEEWVRFKDEEQAKMVDDWLAEQGVAVDLRHSGSR
jgi:hypothetical protein